MSQASLTISEAAELVQIARQAGFGDSTCSRDRGLQGLPDWELTIFVVLGDYTLVTHNSRDFRGDGEGSPGGHHANQPVHAGLVCLNSALPMDLDKQRYWFGLALDELAGRADLVNQALELFEDEDGIVRLTAYEISAPLD